MPGPPSIASSDSSGGGAPLRPRADSITFNQPNQHGNSQQMNTFSSSQMMPGSDQAFAPQYGNATQQPLVPHQVYNSQKPVLTPQRKHVVPQEYGSHLPEPFPPPQIMPTPERTVDAQPMVIPSQPSRPVEDEASLMRASRSFGNRDDSLKPIPKVALSTPPQVDPYQPNISHGIKTTQRQRGSRSKKNYPHHVNPLQMHPVHIQAPSQNQKPQVNQPQFQPPVRPHTRQMIRPQTRQSSHPQDQQTSHPQVQQTSHPQIQQANHPQVQQANHYQSQQMNQGNNTQPGDQVHQQQLIPYNSHPAVQAASQQAAHIPAEHNNQPATQQQLNQPREIALPAWHPDPTNMSFAQQSIWQKVQTIDTRLRLLAQNVIMKTGMNSDLSVNCQSAVHDVGGMVTGMISDLVHDNDRAIQGLVNEVNELKRCLRFYDDKDNERIRLDTEAKSAHDGANFFRAQNDRLREQLKCQRDEIVATMKDAQQSQAHYQELIKGYKEQDQISFAQVQSLESQIRGMLHEAAMRKEMRRERRHQMDMSNVTYATSQLTVAQPGSDSMALVRMSDVEAMPAQQHQGMQTRLEQQTAFNNFVMGRPHSSGQFQDPRTSNNPTFNPKAPAWEPPTVKTASVTTGTKTGGYPYRGGEPPRAPKYMRMAEEAVAQAKERSRANEESIIASSCAAFVLKDTSILDARYAKSFGIVCPPTTLPRSTPEGINAQTILTYPPVSDKDVTEQLWSKARLKTNWDHGDVKAAVEHIYEITKGYVVRCHDKPPAFIHDKNLVLDDPDAWSYMISLAYSPTFHGASHMNFLLNEPHYRPYIIERMIVDYIFNKMFSPSIFMGYSASTDTHLEALQDQIVILGSSEISYNDSRGRTRQRLVEDHAKLAREILERKDISSFRRAVIEKHARALLRLVKSLRCESVTEAECLRLLRVLCGAVWEAATKVWVSGTTVHYYFPPCASQMSWSCMEVLNEKQVGMEVRDLEAERASISFVVTPTLTLRDDREKGYLKTFGIRKAEIIIMKSK